MKFDMNCLFCGQCMYLWTSPLSMKEAWFLTAQRTLVKSREGVMDPVSYIQSYSSIRTHKKVMYKFKKIIIITIIIHFNVRFFVFVTVFRNTSASHSMISYIFSSKFIFLGLYLFIPFICASIACLSTSTSLQASHCPVLSLYVILQCLLHTLQSRWCLVLPCHLLSTSLNAIYFEHKKNAY